jgi:hypothetical protein
MKKTERQAIADHAPWKSPPYDPADAAALQALQRGQASIDQQQRALRWIINQACATYDFAYRPGTEGDRDTVLALGRQFVGQQIVKLCNLKIGLITTRREGA